MADANFRVKNTLVVNNSFVANSTVVNAAAINATSLVATSVNTATANATTSLVVGANVTVNTTTVFVGNGSINTNITAATITINGTNVNTAITGNAATSYTNATTFAANASNITNGTLPNARLGANVVNTSAAFTITGVHTHNANIVFGSAAGIVANGSIGTSGQILASNGSSVYWTTGTSSVRQTFTATAGQNTFSVTGGYTPSLIDVYYNGAKLINGTEVTISSGTDVVLATNAANGATIDVVGIVTGSLSFVNAVAKTGDTMTGTLALPSNGLTVGTTQLVAASGSVGVNTASPSATLTVAGTSNVSGAATFGSTVAITGVLSAISASGINANNLLLQGDATNGYIRPTNSGSFLYLGANNNSHVTLAANGNLGVGNSAPTQKLHVQGQILASDNITAYSDERLKDQIATIESALEIVKQLRGVRYRSKQTGKPGVGVVAQEVRELLPEVVEENGEYLSVAYGNIIGVLIQAIKEQQEKIETLENKVNSLFRGSV